MTVSVALVCEPESCSLCVILSLWLMLHVLMHKCSTRSQQGEHSSVVCGITIHGALNADWRPRFGPDLFRLGTVVAWKKFSLVLS